MSLQYAYSVVDMKLAFPALSISYSVIIPADVSSCFVGSAAFGTQPVCAAQATKRRVGAPPNVWQVAECIRRTVLQSAPHVPETRRVSGSVRAKKAGPDVAAEPVIMFIRCGETVVVIADDVGRKRMRRR
jgi:hypothetical protein